MDKPKLKYRVVSGRNPRTGGVLKRPVITERETYYMDQVVVGTMGSDPTAKNC